jgi:hypothetical protein
MNTSAVSERFDDLDGMLRLAVQQIASAPVPAGAAERMIERAAKWGSPAIRKPATTRTRLYLAASAALVLVLLLAAALTLVGGFSKEKPVAVPPVENKTDAQGSRAEKAPAVPQPSELADNRGVTPVPSNISPDKRGGAQAFGGVPSGGVAPVPSGGSKAGGAAPLPSGGFGTGAVPSKRGGAFGAGASPSRWLSVAGEATILVSTGGKNPVQLGEKQAFTSEAILHVWDWSQSDKSRPLDASCASALSVSPDGKWIVTAKGEKIEIATGKVSPLPHFEPQPHKILFSRDGRRLALLLDGENNTGTFRILELDNGKKLCEIENQWPAMLPAAFSRDGSEIFVMGKDNFVRRYDATAGKELQKYEPAHENSVRTMIASPSGKFLVSSGSRGDILLWEVASGKLLHKLVVEPAVYADVGVYSLEFSPDETEIAGGGIGSLLLWSVETGQVKKFPRGSWGAEHIRFAADGKTVTVVHGFHGTAGPAGEDLLVYPSVSKWDVAEAK